MPTLELKPTDKVVTAYYDNWFFFVMGCAMFLLLVIRTRKEEENLIARFGDDYRNYMQRTGWFVPRLSRRAVV